MALSTNNYTELHTRALNTTLASTALESNQPSPVEWSAELIAEYIARLILCLLITAINILVLATLSDKNNHHLRSATYRVIGSLAVTDLLVGVLGPFGLHIELGIMVNPLHCKVGYAGMIALCSVSINHLLFISVDRYLFLARNPIRYHSVMTTRRVMLFIAGCWMWGGMLAACFLSGLSIKSDWDGQCRSELMFPLWYMVLLTLLHFCIPLVIMVYVYVAIFRVVRGYLKAVKKIRWAPEPILMKEDAEVTSVRIRNGSAREGGEGGEDGGGGLEHIMMEQRGYGGVGVGDSGDGGEYERSGDGVVEGKKPEINGDEVGIRDQNRTVEGDESGVRHRGDGARLGDMWDEELKSEQQYEVGGYGEDGREGVEALKDGEERQEAGGDAEERQEDDDDERIRDRRLSSSSRAKFRAAQLLVLPCLFFYVCWAPWFIAILHAIASHSTVEVKGARSLQGLVVANSLINPLLYAISQPTLGTAMLRKLRAIPRRCGIYHLKDSADIPLDKSCLVRTSPPEGTAV